ncbi:PAS domain-containing sensor histidine kinase [Methylocystis sp. IM3]|uniref:PAS domain-containing sensor histidine kinase n=1 Tax=unclassified Methylocystis TaxID=2625913 RepID=UPI0030F4DA62
MGSSQAEVEASVLAASRIAADPAFSALDGSGAPILAAWGDPLEIVHLNDSARAIFGADRAAVAARLFSGAEPSARRLAELVESVRRGAALRLERLRFDFGRSPQTVTLLCRKLSTPDAPDLLVLAALGVRPAVAPAQEAGARSDASEAPPCEPLAAPDAERALRERLIGRHGGRAPRFLWKTDAAGRFVDVTHVLADVAGAARAEIIGRTVEEVVSDFALDPAVASAVASEKSWSGLSVDWPLDEATRAPVTLGGLPISDADRRFAGFQGYGVIHLDRAFIAAAAPRPPAARTPAESRPESAPEPSPAQAYAADNVVPLRPIAIHREEPEAQVDAQAESLSRIERLNFEEIARALKGGDMPLAVDAALESLAESGAAPADAALEEADRAGAPEGGEIGPAGPVPPSSVASGVLDRLPVGVLIARGARTLFANRTLLDYLGYPDAAAFEADGGLARMFFGRPPGDAGARAAAVQSSDGEALDVDVHLQSVDWDGGPATLVTLRRNRNRLPGPDESALALARELDDKLARLRADNSLLRGILEASGTAVAVVSEEGRIESATGAFAALFEGEKGAFDGLPLTSLFSPEDTRTLAGAFSRAGETGAALRLSERLGGRVFEATLRRLGAAQKPCLTLREDAADARADALRAARDAAEQANAAKSEFLARVSHEIRTPLNAILGFAEVMMQERLGPIGSERYKEYVRDMHASGEHVLSLVNDLLDLSKIEAGKMELEFDRVDANGVITECASIMQTQANKARIVMRLSLSDRLPPVRADARSLKQILLNLLSNAVKFNEPGGQVIVSSALTDSGHVVIRVKDTGIGMSEEEVQTALEPFKQVPISHKRPGTGLGLPLTKALIEANQASFTIRSRKNEGTLIEIAFPPPQVLAAE